MAELVFVGTSDAFGAGGRRQSAALLRGERGAALLDCGVTTNTGLAALGIERDEVDAVLISHYHGDHFGGLPLLLLAARYQDHRSRPLHIAGPPEIEARVRGLARAMGHALDDHELGFPLHFHEFRAGQRQEIGPLDAEAFETHHQIEAHPHGYRVRLGRELVVYSGDTGWFDRLPEQAAGADLFVCECTLHRPSLDFHLSLDQLLEKRGLFDCGRMMLTHLGAEMAGLRGRVEIETADDDLRVKL